MKLIGQPVSKCWQTELAGRLPQGHKEHAMAKKLIKLTLKTRTALHIGSGDGNAASDALLRRDAYGNPTLPGTAIAGSLRTLLTRLAPRLGPNNQVCQALTRNSGGQDCSCLVCELFGNISPGEGSGIQAEKSRIIVNDAYLEKKPAPGAIRDGVGIQRATGAAARAGRVKFDLEVLPADTQFSLLLELSDTTLSQEKLLAAGLAEWISGRGRLGGRVNRGLGAFDIADVEFAELDLGNEDALVAYLMSDAIWNVARSKQDWLTSTVHSVEPISLAGDDLDVLSRCWVKIGGVLQANEFMLTNDTTIAALTGFDHAPLLAHMNEWHSPVLSGASIRGVLRSHAEKIARTITTMKNPYKNGAEAQKWFVDHCPACDPNESRPGEALASCDTLLREHKVLSENDDAGDQHLCLSCRLFGSTRRGSRLVVEDAPYDKETVGGEPRLKMLDFLAIDRFTGGGADQFKFDALALWKPAFRLNLFLENPDEWELGWLALVLRDMQDGWLDAGMGSAKGFGSMHLKGLTIRIGYLTAEDIRDFDLQDRGERTNSVYKEMNLTLQHAEPWINIFTAMAVMDRNKLKLPSMEKDTYYGILDSLDPREVPL
jgi:CRISPR/Cas system CSM-associated protein Csm3 (group 7 of RAMP superfamily)